MAEPKTPAYIVKATGDNETRELHLFKMDNNNYQVKLWWGKGDRYLATLNVVPSQWNRLASFAEGLKRK